MDNIQWYPGHMTKALRMMQENLNLVDVLIELLDARIPQSSKNPDIDNLARHKKRIIVLNKADLADEAATNRWKDHYKGLGYEVAITNAGASTGLKQVAALAHTLMAEKIERGKARGRLIVPIRAMIVGIPNVGKSTMINRYAGKNMAKVADKPGVTKGKQWINISKDFELLDTPGILWGKVEGGLNLAITGAINDNILDREKLALALIEIVQSQSPQNLVDRYKIEVSGDDTPAQILENIAGQRGFKTKDDGLDLLRTSVILLDEYRGGKLGRLTLEMPQPPT
ncbi:MAG: ribosome biogenesis GTPase YlqF [Defluviitaleaceae bacterium]|nr:ribosome biogenesis GTPase YlqF [Defluviitaleaceae bacterium]